MPPSESFEYTPDLSFTSQWPSGLRGPVEAHFATKYLMVFTTWRMAWKAVAAFCIELEEAVVSNGGTPAHVDQCLRALGPGLGELKELMRAKRYLDDPKLVPIIGQRHSPTQICGAVDSYRNKQLKLNSEQPSYAVTTDVSDLSFETLGTADVLAVSPTLAGATGEESIASLLKKLNIDFEAQWPNGYICDFGEVKRPDFKVGGVRSAGDARLSSGFYIETTQRLNTSSRDLGLFYLLHQVAQYSDLPCVVVYDGPNLSDRVWGWAQAFKKKHERDSRLFAVATVQQFREWLLRKIGSQA